MIRHAACLPEMYSLAIRGDSESNYRSLQVTPRGNLFSKSLVLGPSPLFTINVIKQIRISYSLVT